MTLTITEQQRQILIDALEDAINPNYPKSEWYNAKIVRLIKKLGGEA